ncbi:ABC-three component system middle component 6 [Caldifermentibacillus hisashii]|uniref:ABC-three component system middle component 6 n=1 Tax=Caldifermentibacillus hisashii TaxID=996558 RepID=UPI003100DE8F
MMIMPTKHTHFSESLLGFGGYILKKIDSKKTVDSLWNEYQKDLSKKKYPAKHTFDNFLLTLVFLHSIGVIEEEGGGVIKCS